MNAPKLYTGIGPIWKSTGIIPNSSRLTFSLAESRHKSILEKFTRFGKRPDSHSRRFLLRSKSADGEDLAGRRRNTSRGRAGRGEAAGLVRRRAGAAPSKPPRGSVRDARYRRRPPRAI